VRACVRMRARARMRACVRVPMAHTCTACVIALAVTAQLAVLMSVAVPDHMMTGVIFSQLAGHLAAVAYDSETMFVWKGS
jgi:hypothetical protein